MAEIPIAIGVGWVVSPVITLVINKTTTYIENKFFKNAGIEEDMKKMKTTLTEILSVMVVVEKQKIEDLNQAQLVQEIKGDVYDAEDIMDEFEYYLLQEKSEKKQKMVSRLASSSSHSIYRFIIGNKKFKKKVKEVSESLDRSKVSAQMLLEIMAVTVSNNLHVRDSENWCVTSSLISDEIIGREKECASLIDLMLTQSHVSTSQTLPTIIPIVGQGGIGKTTLAQMVFNDSRLNGHFDQKMWLTVSDNFDILRLTREMLKYVCGNYSTVDLSFDMLQRKLEKELELKKILLILDDVWYNKDGTEKYSYKTVWLQFLAPLKRVEQGSRIILTTREPIVKDILATDRSITLDGLNEGDRWSLFELCAFDGENRHKYHELEPIGKDIVNKFKGLALAIRVVGTQLRGNSDVKEWKRTLNDNILDTSDTMKILLRSYEYLPKNLKRCFAYCSLFPKDYRLKPDHLIHMWIAHGFVYSEDRNKLEDVGKSYFKALLHRSFFQVIKKDNKEFYVMHDLMNDLACYVSKGECYMLDKNDDLTINLGSIRHLSITSNAVGVLNRMHGLDKLRTLMLLVDKYWSVEDISNLFIMLKRIRVLDIKGKLQFFSKIGQYKHLRYLSVRYPSDMLVAHDSLSKLHHLNTLFIRKEKVMFPNDIILPKFLYKTSILIFVNTRRGLYVDVGEQVPPQTFWKGVCASFYARNRKMGHQLDLLGNVADIGGLLEISGLENATCREEAIKAELNKKKNVRELRLRWGDSYLSVESSKYHAVLEGLKPNLNLKVLTIIRYPGDAWPSWLESNFLLTVISITLLRCEEIEMVPSLGQLPLLQDLCVSYLTSVRRIGLEFYKNGRFSSLKNLEINSLQSLEEWSYPCNSSVFPKLNKLRIVNCPMLELDNDFLAPQYMEISWYYSLESMFLFRGDVSNFKKLTILKIYYCRELITLQGLHELVSLQRFLIGTCRDLMSLPKMEYFYRLEFLAIIECPKLWSFPKKGLPVSLRILWIGGEVHHDLKGQIQSKKGHDWDKIAAISGCDLYTSFGSSDDWEPLSIFKSRIPVEEYVSRNVKRLQEFKFNKDVLVQ